MLQRGASIRIVYAVCLVGATFNHVRAVLARGWLPESLPIATALYWSSLTFFDPLAAILLLVRPRTGIALTALIIVSDITHNLWFTASHRGGSFIGNVTSNILMIGQIAFLIFVAATARLAWPQFRQSDRRL
jgi:Kef-type K+ transport system membrane component KefB